jgi:hypothetical protein
MESNAETEPKRGALAAGHARMSRVHISKEVKQWNWFVNFNSKARDAFSNF